MGLLDTTPAVIYVATTEDITYSFDPANYLTASGDTSISDPTTEVTDVTTQATVPVTLPDSPAVQGLVILQKFDGSVLVAGHTYVVVVSFTGSPSGGTYSMRTKLQCPF